MEVVLTSNDSVSFYLFGNFGPCETSLPATIYNDERGPNDSPPEFAYPNIIVYITKSFQSTQMVEYPLEGHNDNDTGYERVSFKEKGSTGR